MPIEITTDPTRVDPVAVQALLAEHAYWARGRELEVQRRAIAGSMNIVALDGDVLVGYARLVTDRVTFAWLCDVIVDPNFRGAGIGKRLAAAVADTLDDLGVARAMLVTHDAHGLYAAQGFEPLAAPARWMIRGKQ